MRKSRVPIFPIGFPRKPGSLGFQLERKIKEKHRKIKPKTKKNLSKLPQKYLKIHTYIPLYSLKGTLGSQDPWVSNWKGK